MIIVNDNKLFLGLTRVQSCIDLNNLILGQFTQWAFSNTPANSPYGAGSCFCFGYLYKHQLLISHSTGDRLFRSYYTSWSVWK